MHAETVTARLVHAPPPLAARGSTRRCEQTRTPVGSGSTPSLLPFCTGSEGQQHLQKKEKRKQSLGSSPFSNLFYLCFLYVSVILLLCFRAAVGNWEAAGDCFCHVWPLELEEKRVLADGRSPLRRRGGCRWRADLQTLLEEEGG